MDHTCWSGKAGCIPLCILFCPGFPLSPVNEWQNRYGFTVHSMNYNMKTGTFFAAWNVIYTLHTLGSTLIEEGFRDFWGSITGFCKLGQTILAINQWWTFFVKLRCHQQDKYEWAGILFFYLLFLYSHTFSHEHRVAWWSVLRGLNDASSVFPVDSSAHQFFNVDLWCLSTNSSTFAIAE